MKPILVLLICSLYGTPIFSQTTTDTIVPKEPDIRFIYKNAVHFELFGTGILYSVNYERVLLNKSIQKTVFDIGFSRVPMIHFDGICFPVSVNHLFSFTSNHIELGLGMTPYFAFGGNYNGWGNFYSMRLGYRYQKPNRKFIFRAGVVPIFAFPGFGVWGAINFGYGF